MINGIKTGSCGSSNSGGYIVSAVVDTNGDLIITLSNSQQINAGNVKGVKGDQGEQGLTGGQGVRGENGLAGATGQQGIQGEKGETGKDGRSFEIDRVGYLSQLESFAHENVTFSVLMYDDIDENGSPYLYIKIQESIGTTVYTYNENDPDANEKALTDGLHVWIKQPYTRPLQGERGRVGLPGEAGAQGEQGPVGRGLSPDYSGTLAGRSRYDSAETGAIYLDVDTGNYYIKGSEQHGDWNGAFDFGKGEKGDKGDTGARGPGADYTIKQTVNYTDWDSGDGEVAVDDIVYVVSTGQFLLRVSDDETEASDDYTDITPSLRGEQGVAGKDGNDLHVDAIVDDPADVRNYDKKPLGFMILDADNVGIYVKRHDYPYPGQDITQSYIEWSDATGRDLDEIVYNEQRDEYLAASNDARGEILWRYVEFTKGARGERGLQGFTGEKGEKGDKGETGQGFIANYFGPGLTERDLYDNAPAGASYLDTTNGILYFRQTEEVGQWGPGISISGASSKTELSYVSHEGQTAGNITNDLTTGTLVFTNTITDPETQEETESTTNIIISGSSYKTYSASNVSVGDTVEDNAMGVDETDTIEENDWNHFMYVNWGDLIQPQVWITEAFDTTIYESDGTTEVKINYDDGKNNEILEITPDVHRTISVQLRYSVNSNSTILPIYAHTLTYMVTGAGSWVFADPNLDGHSVSNNADRVNTALEVVELDTLGKYELEPFICDFGSGMPGEVINPWTEFNYNVTNGRWDNFNGNNLAIEVEIRFGSSEMTVAGMGRDDNDRLLIMKDSGDANTANTLINEDHHELLEFDRDSFGRLTFNADGHVTLNGVENDTYTRVMYSGIEDDWEWGTEGEFRFIANRS